MKTYRKPHRVRKKKSIIKNRFFWLSLLLLLFLGTFFYFLIFSRFFQVKKIAISGEERISEEKIKVIVERKLEKRILFFTTKNIFLINPKPIKNDILQSFPQIADIQIKRNLPDTLNFTVIERRKIANFCQNETCFLLDKEGVIFEKSEPEAGLIRIVDGRSGEILKIGEKVIEKDYLDKILKIQKNLSEDLKVEVEEILVLSERLNVKTKEGWEIYFDPKGDLSWQLTKLNLVLKEKIPPEKRKDLEYIELRFGDLATFRYR